jgi:hypothetical protein
MAQLLQNEHGSKCEPTYKKAINLQQNLARWHIKLWLFSAFSWMLDMKNHIIFGGLKHSANP